MISRLLIPAVVFTTLLGGCSKRSPQGTATDPQPTPSVEQAKKVVYKQLTLEILASIKDEDLEQAVIDHVFERMSNYDDESEGLKHLPIGLRALYLTSRVQSEVYNGGFNQYYWNTEGRFAIEAVEAFELLSAKEHAEVMREANEISAREALVMQKFKDRNTREAFSESYKVTKLGPLDDRFYDLDEESLSKALVAKIRSSPELFTGP